MSMQVNYGGMVSVTMAMLPLLRRKAGRSVAREALYNTDHAPPMPLPWLRTLGRVH